MINFEEPVVTENKDRLHDSVETHPSYAQIGASRVSGHACLYGSDFRHQHYVIIRIKQSELHRGLSNDWPHSGEEYIEVAMSEAQWATFVSAMNMGDGVQCTIQRLHRKCIPQIPEPPKRREQFTEEAKKTLDKGLKALDDLRKALHDAKMTVKMRNELLNFLETVERQLSPNIKFVADQFAEHIENVTEHAKVEVAAYITAHIHRAGLEALAGSSPLLLEEKREEK